MKSSLGVFVVVAFHLGTGSYCAAGESPPIGLPQIRFEYELNKKDAKELETKVAALRKGTSLVEVKHLLGCPASEKVLHTKQFFGGGKFVAKEISYVLKRVRANDENLYDHVIELYFDANDKLYAADRLGYALTDSYELLGGVQIRERIFCQGERPKGVLC